VQVVYQDRGESVKGYKMNENDKAIILTILRQQISIQETIGQGDDAYFGFAMEAISEMEKEIRKSLEDRARARSYSPKHDETVLWEEKLARLVYLKNALAGATTQMAEARGDITQIVRDVIEVLLEDREQEDRYDHSE